MARCNIDLSWLIHIFIQQGCIKLIKSEGIYNVTKYLYFKLTVFI